MKHLLINPNQIRWNGLQFQDNPTDDTFIEMGEDLTIPLSYVGTKCVFNSRAPTEQELIYCKHYEMTSNNEWDPEHVDLNKLRGSMQKTNVVREAFSLMADSGKYARASKPNIPSVFISLHSYDFFMSKRDSVLVLDIRLNRW